MEYVLETINLTKKYRETTALKNVNLQLIKGTCDHRAFALMRNRSR